MWSKTSPAYPFIVIHRASFFVYRTPNFGAQKPTKKVDEKMEII